MGGLRSRKPRHMSTPKIPAKCSQHLWLPRPHIHTYTHTCKNIARVDGGVFGFPPFDIVVATRVFQLFVVSNSIKFACALKLIKAAACRALKWRRTHTDTQTHRHTQQYSALIECICVRVFMTKLGPRWHVQGQVAVKSMPKMRLRS